MSSKEEIKKVTASIIEARSNTKLIPDLIKALDDPELSRVALNSIAKVFTHWIKKGDLKAASEKSADPSDPAVTYSKWLQEVFREAFDKITSLIDCPEHDKSFRELCLVIAMKFVVLCHQGDNQTSWNADDVKLFRPIIDSLVSSSHDNSLIIERFQVN